MFDTDGRPLHLRWRYDRSEIVADAVVHALGITFAVVGGAILVGLAALRCGWPETAAVAIYAAGLVALKALSAAYNLWPISRTKWLLRRFDHAGIFVLIAATYTPFLTQMPAGPKTAALFAGVWTVALGGAALKLSVPGRFDRLSVALYLLLGASGALAWDSIAVSLDGTTLLLIAIGGLTYTGGVVFHLWESLRFQNAVWHGFVLAASAVFYSAVLQGVVLA